MLANLARFLPVYREMLQIRDSLKRINSNIEAIRKMEGMRNRELELMHPRYGEAGRLNRYGFQVNSQNGEDGIIHEIFQRIGESSRVFVEIGVGDGLENNTAFLLSQGWNGFWIDGSDSFLETVKEYATDESKGLTFSVSFVDKENITELLEQLQVPKIFDLLSIDIDINTFYIWQALRSFSPRVVVVEYNAAVPPDIEWKLHYVADRVWDGTQNFGASLKAFENLGRQLGYSLVGCDFNGINAFFVRDDLVAGKFAEPFTAENHYEPPRYHYVHRLGHARSILDRQEPKFDSTTRLGADVF
ncbi:MAG: hypothetical protein KY397_01850 [Gemmatimonadetes bacterium]|nr:hypothetical protein [Gemmatimonadota bacterium]